MGRSGLYGNGWVESGNMTRGLYTERSHRAKAPRASANQGQGMSRFSFILLLIVIVVGALAFLLSRMDTSVQPARIEMSVQTDATAG